MRKSAEKEAGKTLINGVIVTAVIAVLLMVGAFFLGIRTAKREPVNDGTLVYVYDQTDYYDSNFDKRGYYVGEAADGSGAVVVTVASGTRSSGGYGIGVDRVDIRGEEVHIYVRESRPGKGEAVTMALTYPTTRVKFNKMPKKITVTGENGEVFSQQ